ncbi:hypothetical protein CcCBS67573_g05876 [Chytriomyces confervae]|uniref:RING-type domain-containing protein n=1 Tax=Chytriomyces confervae TaxID=246404 RepID=A0A507FA35_9FUNG|nr:hypothetical protein HDU80_002105 [Chytriomyces hyalinus]TPX72450.1 hypothetical protein CcCBS67573_g05876 [Chytriomyces confervae]
MLAIASARSIASCIQQERAAEIQRLSRLLTLDLENDAASASGDKATPALEPEQNGVGLCIFTSRAPWAKYQHWPQQLSATIPIILRFMRLDVKTTDITPRPERRRGEVEGGPQASLGSAEQDIKSVILSHFPLLDAFMRPKLFNGPDRNDFNVQLRITRSVLNGGYTANLELRVRWPSNDIETLKTSEALGDAIVKTYWANGGVPFMYADCDFVWTHSVDGGVACIMPTIKIPDTFDVKPCEGPPAPFALTLFDYQLRTLAWMQGVEDGDPALFYAPNLFHVDDGSGDSFFDAESKTFRSRKMDCAVIEAMNVSRGIVADKPGVGKTVTSIALCHSRPFQLQDYLYSMHDGLFRSKATLILVPNTIAGQWEQEIRKCLGNSVKVIQLKGKAAYVKTTFQDILACDFVIVTYQFLMNKNYVGSIYEGRQLANYSEGFDFKSSAKDCKDFASSDKIKGRFSLNWCHYRRIIYDEFHEILPKKDMIDHMKDFHADSIWGLTGTPTFDSINTVWQYAVMLSLEPYTKWAVPKSDAFRFIQHRVRRNEPEATYPAPVHETFSCIQTPMERAFYQSSLSLGVVGLLKLCNHYQIGNDAAGLGMHAPLSIEKVTELVQKDRALQIENGKREIERLQNETDELKKLSNEMDPTILAQQQSMQAKLDQLRNNLATTQSQFNFFENFVSTYLSKGGEKMGCNVCLEDDVQGEIGIVPCGHSFCSACADAISTQGRCPNCREQFQVGQVMKVFPPPALIHVEGEGANDDPESLDPNLFGSKIREVVKYINRESLASEDHRFIVFIQFSDLANLVAAALKTYGIPTARVKSGWQQRENAIRLFRAGLSKPSVVGPAASTSANPVDDLATADPKGKSKRVAEEEETETGRKPAKLARRDVSLKKPVKVLMLSARDSVSGLNLTEASHVIILHPFHASNEALAVASEEQGVARVLRKGQEKTVKIVRFYVEHTVEQAFHEARVRD